MEYTKEEFSNAFCQLLRSLRIKCGFSQSDLADMLDVTRSTFAYYESGKTCPDMFSLRKLADIFGIEVGQFFYPEDFTSKKDERQRAPKTQQTTADPEHIGELTKEERCLIAQYRLGKREEG